ncbi:MAG: hypothetical protein R6W84_08310 [Promethearchaeia archaeon]
MSKENFYDIIRMGELRVSILENSHFSLGTSPYYAHQHALAVDIYQNISLENYEALSPIEGKIFQIKELKAPKPKFKDGIDKEYLILIQNRDHPERIFKTLHINPIVKVGDHIEIGDILGTTIRNGYFSYWSSPHLHLEIRTENDAIRARGGQPFDLIIKNKRTIFDKNNKEKRSKRKAIPITVHEKNPEFILASFSQENYFKVPPFYGVKGIVGDLPCMIDGGIPLYKKGITIFKEADNVLNSDFLYLESSKIGLVNRMRDRFGFFDCQFVKFLLNNIPIRGISLFLANFLPLIKIISMKRNQFSFEKNTIQYLRIESN